MNIVLRVEYLGGDYAGWQRQTNAATVQQLLEEAIRTVSGEELSLHGAGRTDAGVHAWGQVAHFHTQSHVPPEKWCPALNRLLPPTIRVTHSGEACTDFHARFWAKGKQYEYIVRYSTTGSALWYGRAWQLRYPALDMEKLEQAASLLEGTHNFAAFMAAGSSVKDTVRKLYRIELVPQDGLLRLRFSGNGFLYNMVRILTGTMVEVALGKRSLEDITKALETGKRDFAGVTAPAEGLYMAEVWYPNVPGVPDFLCKNTYGG